MTDEQREQREQRAAYIADLERRAKASAAAARAKVAAYEEVQRQFNLAMQAYTDSLTAPWRALAEEIRRGMKP